MKLIAAYKRHLSWNWALGMAAAALCAALGQPSQQWASAADAAAKAPAAPAAETTAKAPKPEVDPNLPEYKAGKAVKGRLKSVGSDTMNNLMDGWSENFKKLYPEVTTEVEGKGSGTAVPALIQGTADIGPMSRDIDSKESAEFKTKFGYEPTQVATSIDMLAVYVHKDNPIQSLSLDQLDAIFSVARKRGYEKEIRTWGDLGLEGEWASKPISLYGRDPASGTQKYFKENVLEKGDFKPTVKQLAGSSAVVSGVANDEAGIGYSGIGYRTADVRVVPLAKNSKSKPVAAEPAHAYDGTYPLSRFLYLTVNYKPNSTMSPLIAEFLTFVLSKEGQAEVIKAGFLPLPAKVAESARKKAGLTGK